MKMVIFTQLIASSYVYHGHCIWMAPWG